MKLFHGTNTKLDTLKPATTDNPREIKRLGGETEALYASEYPQVAMAHGIGKTLNLDRHPGYGHKDSMWSISLPCDKDLQDPDAKIYIYEVPEGSFKKTGLDEWVTSENVTPDATHEFTVGESLSHFDEVKFLGDQHGPEGGKPETWI